MRRSLFVSIVLTSTIPFKPGTDGNFYKARNMQQIVAIGEMWDQYCAVCSAAAIARRNDRITRVLVKTQIAAPPASSLVRHSSAHQQLHFCLGVTQFVHMRDSIVDCLYIARHMQLLSRFRGCPCSYRYSRVSLSVSLQNEFQIPRLIHSIANAHESCDDHKVRYVSDVSIKSLSPSKRSQIL